MGLTTLSLMHVAAALEAREPKGTGFARYTIENARFLQMIGAAVPLAFLVTGLAPLQRIFGTVSVTSRQWGICLLGPIVLLVLFELGSSLTGASVNERRRCVEARQGRVRRHPHHSPRRVRFRIRSARCQQPLEDPDADNHPDGERPPGATTTSKRTPAESQTRTVESAPPTTPTTTARAETAMAVATTSSKAVIPTTKAVTKTESATTSARSTTVRATTKTPNCHSADIDDRDPNANTDDADDHDDHHDDLLQPRRGCGGCRNRGGVQGAQLHGVERLRGWAWVLIAAAVAAAAAFFAIRRRQRNKRAGPPSPSQPPPPPSAWRVRLDRIA